MKTTNRIQTVSKTKNQKSEPIQSPNLANKARRIRTWMIKIIELMATSLVTWLNPKAWLIIFLIRLGFLILHLFLDKQKS